MNHPTTLGIDLAAPALSLASFERWFAKEIYAEAGKPSLTRKPTLHNSQPRAQIDCLATLFKVVGSLP
jgi:hypothetical protein